MTRTIAAVALLGLCATGPLRGQTAELDSLVRARPSSMVDSLRIRLRILELRLNSLQHEVVSLQVKRVDAITAGYQGDEVKLASDRRAVLTLVRDHCHVLLNLNLRYPDVSSALLVCDLPN